MERDRDVPGWPPWYLEPVWVVVIAAVLTQLGRAELGFATGQVDALGLDRLSRMSLDELEGFTHVAAPKELPVIQLREVAKVLGLAAGIVSDQGVNEAAAQQFLTAASNLMERVTTARQTVQAGGLIGGLKSLSKPTNVTLVWPPPRSSLKTSRPATLSER